MRVLLTRAREDAEPLAARLTERGLESEIEPLLTFIPEGDGPLELAATQALVFTSATGARMFAERSPEREIPVFAVGDATAAAARTAGFSKVESAAGDVDDLARLIKARLDPKAGALFHGAARQVAGDLGGHLTAAGFEVRREILYEARPIEAFSDSTLSGLAEGRFDAVALFSPRTAETFVRLVEESGPEALGPDPGPDPGPDRERGCHAVCLSQAVASRIEALPWVGVRIAERPNQEALIDLLVALKLDLEAPRQQVTANDGSSADESMTEDQENAAPSDDPGEDQEQPAMAVIAEFGGIRPMATKLDIAVSTVQGWRERGVIPASRHPQILQAALEHDIDIDPDLVSASADRSEAAEAVHGEDPGDTPLDGQDERSDAAPETESETGPDGASSDQLPPSLSEPLPAPPLAPPLPARRGRGVLIGFLLAIIVMVAGAAAAVLTRDQWLPLVDRGAGQEVDTVGPALQALDGKLAALGSELGSLGTSLTALEARVQDQPAAPSDQTEAQAALGQAVEDMTKRIAALEADLAAAGQSTGTTDGGAAPENALLGQRLTDLEARLDGLSAPSGEAPSLAPLLERLASLEERLAQVDQITPLGEQQTALSAQVEVSAERLASLEQRSGEAGERIEELEQLAAEAAKAPAPNLDGAASVGDVALMLAINQLKDAVASPGSYAAPLATVSGLMADIEGAAEPLATLTQSAAAGAPTREDLRRQFPAVARKIVAAGAGDNSDSWTAGAMRSLASIVTLRKTGEVAGDSADALVARTEVRVRDGDLDGAVEQLGGLSGHAAKAAEGWRSRAEQRLNAERAVSLLTEQIIARIAPSGN